MGGPTVTLLQPLRLLEGLAVAYRIGAGSQDSHHLIVECNIACMRSDERIGSAVIRNEKYLRHVELLIWVGGGPGWATSGVFCVKLFVGQAHFGWLLWRVAPSVASRIDNIRL